MRILNWLGSVTVLFAGALSVTGCSGTKPKGEAAQRQETAAGPQTEAQAAEPASQQAQAAPEKVRAAAGGALEVEVENSLLGERVVLPADLVVLAVGMVPRSADGEAIRIYNDQKKRAETTDSDKQREDALKLAEQYKEHAGTEILHLGYRQGPDLPVLADGFPDSHFICFPYETRRTGIYAAGALRGPMEPFRASEDGWGAAMKAMQCVREAAVGEAVHPRAGDFAKADFFLQRCTQCKRCTEECPFGTLNEDAKGTPEYNPLRCRQCGICMGSCPERIINFADYSVDAVASMVKAMEVPGGGIDKNEYRNIDSKPFHQLLKSKKPFFLVLGRKSGAKNYSSIIEAVERVNGNEHICNLVMIGRDEDGAAIESQYTHYLGEQPREVVLGALKECYGLVTMSESESFGIVILEAWALKKPVIVNEKCPAFVELVEDKVNGLYAKESNIADQLQLLLDNKDLSKKLGQTGNAAIDRYTWRNIGQHFYRYLLSPR